jgi:hypothetical protein
MDTQELKKALRQAAAQSPRTTSEIRALAEAAATPTVLETFLLEVCFTLICRIETLDERLHYIESRLGDKP